MDEVPANMPNIIVQVELHLVDLEDYPVDREHPVEEHHLVLQEEHMLAEAQQVDLQLLVEPAPQLQAVLHPVVLEEQEAVAVASPAQVPPTTLL